MSCWVEGQEVVIRLVTDDTQRTEDVLRAAAYRERGIAGARLARMSGSGATCFALFDDLETAIARASDLRARCPGWWVAATRLC